MIGFRKRARGAIPTPEAGSVYLTVDTDGLLVFKKEDGSVVAPESLISTLAAAVAGKQDASTAATDAELAAEKSAREAADNVEKSARESLASTVAEKQDATTAATDAELAGEKSAREAADTAEAAAREAADDDLAADLATKQAAATAATDAEVAAGLATKQSTSEKGQANGYPSLDGSGHVPAAQMPVGALTYKGTWNAATNSPALTDGGGTVGEQYAITVGGTRNLGSGSIEFVAGSVLQHNGSVWQQISSPDAVASVFGRKGAVVAQSGDYAIGQISGSGSAAGKDAGAAGAAGKVLNADDPVLPTTGQKNALAGLHGTPGTGNEFLTKQSIGAAGVAGKALAADDATTTDARTPLAHTHTASEVTDLQGLLDGKLDAGVTPEEIGAATSAFLESVAVGVVKHGANVNLPRPSGVAMVVWVGTVVPANAAKEDLLVNKEGI